ncbi:unnamed protein product [Pleuronectes platessa]|uniref:Uncharacterized protein n=1 Tax=Pleuronectes platessa TaxID=8262 RepID=A0A9N7U847_PLEPL|nr:unnamed protein product [Pleuronectes platessa]
MKIRPRQRSTLHRRQRTVEQPQETEQDLLQVQIFTLHLLLEHELKQARGSRQESIGGEPHKAGEVLCRETFNSCTHTFMQSGINLGSFSVNHFATESLDRN